MAEGVTQVDASTPVTVAASATSVTLAAANPYRRAYKVFNDSSAAMYVDESGGTATTSSFTYKIAAGGFYESGPTVPIDKLTALWDSATGNARVTEFQ